jgi:drug/metabolite transporter (DMT)-like permease
MELLDFLLAGVTLVWGVNSPVVKFALSGFLPLAFNGVRFTMATAILFVCLRLVERDVGVRRADLARLAVAGILGNFVYQVCFIKGINLSLAGNTAFVLATMPVTTALLGHLTGIERVPGRSWLGMAVAMAGVLLISVGGGRGVSLSNATIRGDLITFAGTLAWCYYTLLVKPLFARYSALKVTAWTMLFGTACLAASAVPELAAQDWTRVGPWHWTALVFSGTIAISGSYIAWNWGLARLGMARTTAYTNLVPVSAGLVGWLWLGEPWNAVRLGGAALTLAGLAVMRRAKMPAPAPDR